MQEENRLAIRENIARIRDELREHPNVRIMAVIKTRTPEEINYAVRECGITLLGENRVQELQAHYDALDRSAELHFIGSLQKNKVKYIIDKVDMIESLDSESLAAEIDRQAKKHGKTMPVLIEINIGREPSKGGILPEELPSFCDAIARFDSVCPKGLMTIAPICENTEDYHAYFAEMKRLADEVFAVKFPQNEKPLLSMGMSGSFRQALANGSDVIRVGEGIFGKRGAPYKGDGIAPAK